MAAGGNDNMPQKKNSANLRTALILLSVAVAFFIGVVIKHTVLK